MSLKEILDFFSPPKKSVGHFSPNLFLDGNKKKKKKEYLTTECTELLFTGWMNL